MRRTGLSAAHQCPTYLIVVPKLIEFVDANERLQDLFNGALMENPGNTKLKKISDKYGIEEIDPELPPGEIVPVEPTIPIEMVEIPAGYFEMGSKWQSGFNQAYKDEAPPSKIHLDKFFISKYPITRIQFASFVRSEKYRTTAEQQGYSQVWTPNGDKKLRRTSWRGFLNFGTHIYLKRKHPVTHITWHDAIAFCEWARVRLPTEAEWEKAARGINGHKYPWGNDEPDSSKCNFFNQVDQYDDDMATTRVNKYKSGLSPFGVWDMVGNVREWTSSLKGNYPYRAGDGRENSLNYGNRILRGGAFMNMPWDIRCARRFNMKPDYCSNYIGFRVVALTETK